MNITLQDIPQAFCCLVLLAVVSGIQLFCFCQSQKSLQDLHQGYPFRLRVSHAHHEKPKLVRGGPHARTLFGSVGLPPDKIRPKRYF